MSVNFAGAKNLGERRRRRIVSENENPASLSNKKNPQAGYLKLVRYCPETKEPPRAPIASLVPENSWKIWGACLAIPLLLAGLYCGCLLFAVLQNSPAEAIFHPQQGHAWRFLQGTLLLGAAGLCWLIGWFRSASVKDFEGCFKSWYWSGWILMGMGLLAGVDGHLVLSELLVKQLPFEISSLSYANFKTLIWAVPMLSLLSESLRCFVREMWHCRRSWIFLWGGCLSGLVYLGAKLEGPHTAGLLPPTSLLVVTALASVMSAAFLFCSLLSQIHHVMYVSSDPVPLRQSWLINQTAKGICWTYSQTKWLVMTSSVLVCTGLLRAVSGRKRKKAKATPGEKQNAESTTKTSTKSRARKTTTSQAEAKPEKTTSRRRRAKTTTAELEATAVESVAEEVAEEEQIAAEVTEKPARKPKVRINAKSQTSKVNSAKAIPADPPAKEAIMTAEEAWQEYEAEQSPEQNAVVEPQTIPVTQEIKSDSAAQDQDEDWDSWQDPELDPEALRGLSKKEKKKLRKNHRDQMRAKAG